MVNGRVVAEDGRLLGVDEEEVRDRAWELADALLEKAR